MSYKVEYLAGRSTLWILAGSFASERSAIFNAEAVAHRKNVTKVRVTDPSRFPVWMS